MELPFIDGVFKLYRSIFPKDVITAKKETVEKAKSDFLNQYQQDKGEQIFGHALLVPNNDNFSTRDKVEVDIREKLNKRYTNVQSIRFDWDHLLDEPYDLNPGQSYQVLSGVEYSRRQNSDYTDAATIFIKYK